jgi:hypothetical protein
MARGAPRARGARAASAAAATALLLALAAPRAARAQTCNSGDPSTTCTISTNQTISGAASLSGVGQLVIDVSAGGALVCASPATPDCTLSLDFASISVAVQPGSAASSASAWPLALSAASITLVAESTGGVSL